jgi:lipopolysaccharide transport system permease protein
VTRTVSSAAHGGADPAEPWMVIDAADGTQAIDLAELWRYRDLLYFLTRREVTVRYKQTVLGFLWAVIQPLASMVVFTVFLGTLAGVPSDGIPYPVFSYLGLALWTYFAAAVTRSGASLAGNAHLLTRVYFPRVLVPLSATLAALVDFAIAFLALGGLMAWYGLAPGATGLLAIPLVAVTALAAAGIGMWLGALNARYRDVQHAWPFLVQLWMFATPVVYPASLVPERWRPLLALNPLAGLIEGFRAAMLGRPLDGTALAISIASAAALAALGVWQFRRMERAFADTV